MRWIVCILAALAVAQADWDGTNIPNPTTTNFRECRMTGVSNICDPDGMVSDQARVQLDSELKQFESRTRNESGETFCEKRGVTAGLAIVRNVRGRTVEAQQQMANDMLARWALDNQCRKAIAMVLSTDDQRLTVAREENVPVTGAEFTQIIDRQIPLFQKLQFVPALNNVLRDSRAKAYEKNRLPAVIRVYHRNATVVGVTTYEPEPARWHFIDYLWPLLLLLLLLSLLLCGLAYFFKRRQASKSRAPVVHKDVRVVTTRTHETPVVVTEVKRTPLVSTYAVDETHRPINAQNDNTHWTTR
ncbi:unnamed protein product [Caenorhabditis auriculariae]|uniref:TPM domain-containing protein n=1 Tax=Caenorhabditis auriculariae TaxID=2777116 RepID=A0A8S1HFU8_9PELO|nr:unnamed protein product [Caenorhabditis auriculariae]